MTEPTWITSYDDALAFHDVLLDLYGGSAGVRDAGLVESALARPQNVYHHESRELVILAATYAHGLAKNHGFVDGNKRTALVCALTFLRINGAPFQGRPSRNSGHGRGVGFEQGGP